jgi:hypothetical protein
MIDEFFLFNLLDGYLATFNFDQIWFYLLYYDFDYFKAFLFLCFNFKIKILLFNNSIILINNLKKSFLAVFEIFFFNLK